jgi:hypothetical protein
VRTPSANERDLDSSSPLAVKRATWVHILELDNLLGLDGYRCYSKEPMSDLENYTLLGSSIFTAVAAFASWASVAQHRQDAQERHEPNLLGAVTQLEGPSVGEKTPTSMTPTWSFARA